MCDYREQLRWKGQLAGQLAANISAKLGDIVLLRGDFLKNRVFLAKSAQNLVTKPAGENPLTAIIFSNKFSKICENVKNFTGSLAT